MTEALFRQIRTGFALLLLGLVGWTAIMRPGVTLEPPWPALLVAGVLACASGIAVPLFGFGSRTWTSVQVLSAFLGWMVVALSLGGSLDMFRSKTSLLGWVGFAGCYFAVLVSVRARSEWRRIAWGLVLICSALSLYGIVVFRLKMEERLLSTFVNADCFSLFPVVGILLSLGLFHNTGSLGRGIIHANSLMSLLALLLTGSRAGLLGLLAGVVTVTFLLWLRCRSRDFRPMVDTLSPLFVGFALLALSSLFILPGTSRWKKLLDGHESEGIRMRQDVFVNGLEAASRKPLLGYGPGTFSLAYQQFRPFSSLGSHMYVNVAHNDYVEIAVESGLPALVIWFGFVGVVCERASRFVRKSPQGHEVAGSSGAVVALATYSTLNFIVAVPADLFLYACVLALSIAPVHAGENFSSKRARWFQLALGVSLLLAGMWSCAYSWRNHRSYQAIKAAQKALANLELESAESYLLQAASLTPERAYVHELKAQLYSYMAATKAQPQYTRQALESLQLARSLSPRNLAVIRELSLAYLEAGKREDAAKLLREALLQAPYYDGFRQDLVRVYFQKGQVVEALQIVCDLYARDEKLMPNLAKALSAVAGARSGAIKKALGQAQLPPEKLEPVIAAARKSLIAERKFEDADQVQRVWGELHGEDSCFWLERATIWKRAGDPKRELTFLSRGVEDKNLNSACYEQALLEFTKVANKIGRAAQAKARLTAYIERGSAGPVAYAALANIHLEQKNVEAARHLIMAALENHERNAALLVVRAKIGLLEGSAETAVDDAKQALEAEPENAEAREILDKARAKLNNQ